MEFTIGTDGTATIRAVIRRSDIESKLGKHITDRAWSEFVHRNHQTILEIFEDSLTEIGSGVEFFLLAERVAP